jgi:hypothetical protein
MAHEQELLKGCKKVSARWCSDNLSRCPLCGETDEFGLFLCDMCKARLSEFKLIKKAFFKSIDDWIEDCRNDRILIGGFREDKLKEKLNNI